MGYVDAWVLPIRDGKVEDYLASAREAGQIWMEHGALAYVEAQADDVPYGEVTSFPRSVQQQDGETVFLSYALYRSREHRDEVMGKVMADPRLQATMEPMKAIMDGKRMFWGGFRTVVSA